MRLLNARAACALEIGRVKKEAGLPIYQPSREAEVLGHVQEINPGPLDDGAVRRLFERIIDEARRLERIAEGDRPGADPDAPSRRRSRRGRQQDRSSMGAGRQCYETIEDLMVVVMKERANDEQVQRVIAQLVEMGFDVHRSTGALKTVIGAVGGNRQFDSALIEVMDGVQEVHRITEPYKLASRSFRPENTVITIGDVRIGGDEVIVMAGPCSAETEEQVEATAAAVKNAGAKVLRGGAFKPRSSPYSFQGLGEEGLKMLRGAADRHNLKLVSEVMDISQLELIEKYSDILQVGARNMQNYTLLRELGHAKTPVLLEARHLGDDRGVAALGRVHPRRRQHERHAVRARHPHVRELHAQHARHLGDSGRAAALAPAGARRSEPRHGPPRQGRRRWRARPWPPAPMG